MAAGAHYKQITFIFALVAVSSPFVSAILSGYKANAADDRSTKVKASVMNGSTQPLNGSVLNFPRDHSVGSVIFTTATGELKPVPACGQVPVPSNAGARLIVNYQTGLNLSPLKALGPNSLEQLSLTKLEITDDQLANIKHLTGLKQIDLGETDIDDRGLDLLASMHSLKFLDIHGTCITARGLAAVGAHTTLDNLNLSNNNIGAVGLEPIKPLQKLKTLRIARSRITNIGLHALGSLMALESLDLECNGGVTDIGISYLMGLKRLNRLDLANTSFTVQSTKYLKQLPSLRHLIYSPNNLKPEEVGAMRRALPQCSVISDTQLRYVNVNLYAPLH
jgi:hypothetical protein